MWENMEKITQISYRERWRQLKLAHCAIPNYGNSKEFWSDKKNVQTVYLKRRENYQQETDTRLSYMAIPDGSRVLDIGSGPGPLTIPLAKKGCHLTAVEPSPVMREVLIQRIQEEGISNVTIIPKRWEDVAPEELGAKYDVVIASYSLTMMDIAEAIEKMQKFCRGTVHLFWFLTPPAWVRVNRDLWPLLHGGEFPGEPMADWLWLVLYEMGIYANLAVETKFHKSSYTSIDEATNEYLNRLNCTTPEQEAIVKNYFSSILRQYGTEYVLGDETLGAHIWWKNE